MKRYSLFIIDLLTLSFCKGQENKTAFLDQLKYNAETSFKNQC